MKKMLIVACIILGSVGFVYCKEVPKNETKKVQLTVELVQVVMNYLGNRPYIEVAPLIVEIQKQVSQK